MEFLASLPKVFSTRYCPEQTIEMNRSLVQTSKSCFFHFLYPQTSFTNSSLHKLNRQLYFSSNSENNFTLKSYMLNFISPEYPKIVILTHNILI